MMGFNLLEYKPLFKIFQENFLIKAPGFVRHASRKSATSHPRKANHGKPPVRGFIRRDGDTVKSGELIYMQRELRYCPGENVGISTPRRLFAWEAGKVYVTTEKTNFNPEHHYVLCEYPNALPPYKKYIHVVSKPQHRRFKLVEKF